MKKGIRIVATQSLEDYLEAILMLNEEKGYARATDLANILHYTKASVSVAVKKLKDEEFIYLDEKSHIFLTLKGKDIANKVLHRHHVLTRFLEKLGISEKTAEEDACTIEHVISEETFDAIEQKLTEWEN